MLNDRGEKFEDHEDSEYHFSDEEVSYEVEPETQKAAPVAATNDAKQTLVARLTGSKRMLISAGVFLVLIFVVYKMVSPTTTTAVSTDIVAPAPTAQQTNPAVNPALANQQSQMAAAPAPAPATTTNPPNTAPTTAMNMNQPTATQTNNPTTPMPAPVNQVQAAQQQLGQTQANANPSMMNPAQSQAAAMQQPGMGGQNPGATSPAQPSTMPPPPSNMNMSASPNANNNPTQQEMMTSSNQQPVVQVVPGPGMPNVIPVESAQPAANPNQQSMVLPGSAAIDAKMSNISAENEKLIGQLEGQYTQKINDYAMQNKALQDQVQTLNSRVANMESQMNQLIQALTRQPAAGGAAPAPGSNAAIPPAPLGQPVPAPAQPQSMNEPRSSYNVQAIIPGRAWLRSDNGETLTVAEGDVIKELGRVTKIDPYDGVVEINTGTKVISLSYGNGSG